MIWRRSGAESSRWLYVVTVSVSVMSLRANSVKCTTRFPATRIYRADCFFQSTKTLFVAGTYDLLEDLSEVLEQFHRLAAQYWILLSRHHFAQANAREQNAHHKAKLKNQGPSSTPP
jgi:hypothetical protein